MKSKFALFLVAASMLASCGGGNTPVSSQSTPAAESSSAAETYYLDWVAQGKIVIELFDVGEARFTYGNAALQATQTLDLNASADLACSSSLTSDQTFNFVFVTETTAGTGFNAGAALYPGIEGDKLSDFLKDSEELKGKARAYVAISYGETVKWTKGKNAAMDTKIESLVNTSK